MRIEPIEAAIDKYVQERMQQGRQRAREHFLAYAYLKCGGTGARDFMKKAGGLCRYYIDYLRVMENPFRGPEMWWFATMVLVALYSCYLMGLEDDRLIGIMVFSGTLVNFFSLIRIVGKKWSDTGVMIAIYHEIAEIAENEVRSAA